MKVQFVLATFFLILTSACRTSTQDTESLLRQNSSALQEIYTFPGSGESISKYQYRLTDTDRKFFLDSVSEDENLKNISGLKQIIRAERRLRLDFAEASAVYSYTVENYLGLASYFNAFNTGQRSELTDSDRFAEVNIKAILSALNGLPSYTGDVYFGQILNMEEWQDKLKVGKIFSQANFTSSSYLRMIAEEFAAWGRGPEGATRSVLFKVKDSCGGHLISPVSSSNSEAEVLFRPDHLFKIISVNVDEQEQYFIEMEESKPCHVNKPNIAWTESLRPKLCKVSAGAEIWSDQDLSQSLGVFTEQALMKRVAESETLAEVDQYVTITKSAVEKCAGTDCGPGDPIVVAEPTKAFRVTYDGSEPTAIAELKKGAKLTNGRIPGDNYTVYLHAYVKNEDLECAR